MDTTWDAYVDHCTETEETPDGVGYSEWLEEMRDDAYWDKVDHDYKYAKENPSEDY